MDGFERSVLPIDIKSEMTAIGAALVDDYAASALAFANHEAKGNLFHHPQCAHVAKMIQKCIEEKAPVSMNTVFAQCKDKERNDIASFLADCASLAPTSTVIDYMLEKLLDIAVKRHAAINGESLCYLAFDENVTREMILNKIAEIQDFCSTRIASNAKPAGEALAAYFELCKSMKNNKGASGFDHCFPELKKFLPTFKRKELHVIAARPSIGKTALMTELVTRGCVTKARQNALIVSIEMSAEQLVARMLSQATGYSSHFIAEGNHSAAQAAEISLARDMIVKSGVVIADPSTASILDVCRIAKREKALSNIESVWIDYMQLITGTKTENREREVAGISSMLKGLAKELDVPVVCLAQLRRFNTAEAPIPTLDHLRESGAIEQDADTVTLIHRQRYLKDEDKAKGIYTLDTQLFVAKHRNGETGIADVKYHPFSTRFVSDFDNHAMAVSNDARLPYKEDEEEEEEEPYNEEMEF